MITITDSQTLESLASGTVVRSAAGMIACRFDETRGVVFGDDRPFPWSILQLPVVILFDPEVNADEAADNQNGRGDDLA